MAIFYAASQGNIAEVKRLLQSIDDPVLEDERGMSALHRAAWEGHIDIVRLLSEHDLRMISHRDMYGRVPLDCAAENS
jgi:ankyrin repeat protein